MLDLVTKLKLHEKFGISLKEVDSMSHKEIETLLIAMDLLATKQRLQAVHPI